MIRDKRIHFCRGPLTAIVSGPHVWLVLNALYLSLKAELRLRVVKPLNFECGQIRIILSTDVAAVGA